MERVTPKKQALYVIGADAELSTRLRAGIFPFSIIYRDDFLPNELHLVPFPQITDLYPRFPLDIQFIGCGPSWYLETAFLTGAKDFIKEPWDLSELTYRASRFLNGSTQYTLPRAHLTLNGFILSGPNKSVILSYAEAILLRILLQQSGTFVPKKFLLKHIWNRSDAKSRVLEVSISRLRKKMLLCDPLTTENYIHSQRNKGYLIAP